MSKVFKLTRNGAAGSDCTSPYKVSLNGTPTVADFIAQVLKRRNEWGDISIRTKHGNHVVSYEYGRSDVQADAEYMSMTIKEASADGGYSAMDYILYV